MPEKFEEKKFVFNSRPLVKGQTNYLEGCGGLRGEDPGALPKAEPLFQQPRSLPESAQTLAGTAFRAAGKSGKALSSSKGFGQPQPARVF